MAAAGSLSVARMRSAAKDTTAILRALANEDRLLLLCQLSQGEKSVGELETLLDIHQPTLSQQLGVLREEGVVETRRDGKRIYYSVADRKVLALLKTLYGLYCPGTEENLMSVDWNAFSPAAALIGGALIGGAAALFVVLNGRIAGVSGILGGLLRPVRGDIGWRVAFVSGLVAAPLVYGAFAPLPAIRIDTGYAMLVAAGLLVGVGTRYGSGCTSGHGVCGISRLSPRSIVATLVFMAAGFATVFIARHLIA